MNELTHDELQEIVSALSRKTTRDTEKPKIPLRPPGNYKQIAKISLSPLTEGSKAVKDKKENFDHLSVTLEVVFGQTVLTLKELETLQEGSLLPLEEHGDELVHIYANGTKVAQGEIVAVDQHFAIRILSFTKN